MRDDNRVERVIRHLRPDVWLHADSIARVLGLSEYAVLGVLIGLEANGLVMSQTRHWQYSPKTTAWRLALPETLEVSRARVGLTNGL